MPYKSILNVKTPSLLKISKKFNVPMGKLQRELRMGIGVEHEHTRNSRVAERIALAHLSEIPDYYSNGLKAMEKAGKKRWKNRERPIKESVWPKIKTWLRRHKPGRLTVDAKRSTQRALGNPTNTSVRRALTLRAAAAYKRDGDLEGMEFQLRKSTNPRAKKPKFRIPGSSGDELAGLAKSLER